MSRPDPAGVLASDDHRRVLAHLSLPSDDYGWSVPALKARMAGDPATEGVEAVLGDLVVAGDAEEVGGAFRMTEVGFDRLTGPIADEPPPDAKAEGPAMLGLGSVALGPTPIKRGGS